MSKVRHGATTQKTAIFVLTAVRPQILRTEESYLRMEAPVGVYDHSFEIQRYPDVL
jgi:hypothetical protein